MNSIEELQTKLDAARQNSLRLRVALDAARARYQTTLTNKGDLSDVDVEALAAGAFNADAESALKAVREIERRCKDADAEITSLRQELYYAQTAPTVEEYLIAVEGMLSEFQDMIERMEAAEELLSRVRYTDPRIFHIGRTRRELQAAVDLYWKWRNPQRGGKAGRVWRNPDGAIEYLDTAEYERRETARRAAMRRPAIPSRGMVPLGFE